MDYIIGPASGNPNLCLSWPMALPPNSDGVDWQMGSLLSPHDMRIVVNFLLFQAPRSSVLCILFSGKLSLLLLQGFTKFWPNVKFWNRWKGATPDWVISIKHDKYHSKRSRYRFLFVRQFCHIDNNAAKLYPFHTNIYYSSLCA